MEKLLEKINFFSEAKRLGIPFWQHPQFLFLISGIIICFFAIFSYWIPQKYFSPPEASAIFSLFGSAILLFFSFLITKNMEKILQFNQLKKELLNILAHNLAGPIISLKWLLEAEKEKIDQESLQMFKSGITKLEEVVDKLILVTGLEKMIIEKKKENFLISEITKKLIKEFEKEIGDKNLQIKIEVENEKEVFENKRLISLVIKNLLENAISYSLSQNKVLIKIFGKNNKIFFRIEDEGIGIGEKERKYLFQKFFRGKEVLKHQIKGLGLGLYISKLIVENCKGKIGYLPKEKGSIFWFCLLAKNEKNSFY